MRLRGAARIGSLGVATAAGIAAGFASRPTTFQMIAVAVAVALTVLPVALTGSKKRSEVHRQHEWLQVTVGTAVLAQKKSLGCYPA